LLEVQWDKFSYIKTQFSKCEFEYCYNNPIIFSLTTISYLDCLQKCKPNDEDLNLIDADKCALKPNANATQKN
jgi:hypothetical protein